MGRSVSEGISGMTVFHERTPTESGLDLVCWVGKGFRITGFGFGDSVSETIDYDIMINDKLNSIA